MSKFLLFVEKHKTIPTLLGLLLLTFLSQGKTWQMYYWVDDLAMTYKLVWPQDSLTNMASGIIGTGPYRYLITPFALLYPLFGLSPFPYFFIGWVIYFFAAFCVYLLALELSRKRQIALAASSVFASGYIGAHALYRLTNSYQTVGATAFICLTVWLFAKFLQTPNRKTYWFCLLFYTVVIEAFFIRAHGLFLSILGLSVLYKFIKRTDMSYKLLFLKLLPFFVVFYFMYFVDPRVKIQSGLVLTGLDALLKLKEFELINNFMITLANVAVPDQVTSWVYSKLILVALKLTKTSNYIQLFPASVTVTAFILIIIFLRDVKKSWKVLTSLLLVGLYLFAVWSFFEKTSLWNPRGVDIFTSVLGEGLIAASFLLGISMYSRKHPNGLLIPFALFWIIVNVLTLFIYSPSTNLESTSRYLVPAFAGIGMLYASVFWLTFKKPIALILTSLVCLTLLYFSNKEADNQLRYVSQPDKQGYGLIQDEVKEINENTLFFVESEDDPKYRNNYLGRLPQHGISAFYKYHGVTKFANSHKELFSRLASGELVAKNVYTYFYGKGGYASTTAKFRELLQNGGKPLEVVEWTSNTPFEKKQNVFFTKTLMSNNEERTVGINPVLESEIAYDSLTPAVLHLTLTIKPIYPKNTKFPYYDLSQEFPLNTSYEMLEAANPKPKTRNSEEIISTVYEERERQALAKTAQARATSVWSESVPQNITDGRLDTNWSANNNDWNDGKKPQEIFIDLGAPKEITKIVWINHHYMSTPINYTFYSSVDGFTWNRVKEVKDGPRKEGAEETRENIYAINTKYIKMSILETYGGRGYPPAIEELWVSSRNSEVEQKKKERILACPYCYIPDLITYEQTLVSLRQTATAKLWWQTDRSSGYLPSYSKSIEIFLDGRQHTYTIYLPPQGTRYKRLKIGGFQAPVEIALHKAIIRSLNLSETMQSSNLWNLGQ